MKKSAGFISLATAAFLTIAGSLTYTAIEFLNNQNKVNSIHNHIIQLNDSESALNSFIKLSGRLPCPSKIRGGKEDCSPRNQKGWLPTQTLMDRKIITNQIYNDISNVRYLVYRSIESQSAPIQSIDFASPDNTSPPDLAINSDIYKPYILSKSITETLKSEIISPNDFCQKLKNIKGLTNLEQANIPLSENINSNRTNIAYAIAVSNGNEFSPINANNNPEMESPSRIQNGLYTDSVRAVGALPLMNLIGCENNFLAMDALQIANKEIQTQVERKTLIKAHIQWNLIWKRDLLNLTIALTPHDILALVEEIPADVSISAGRIEGDTLRCALLFFIACFSIPQEINITANKAVQIGSKIASILFTTFRLTYLTAIIALEEELLEKLEKFTLWDQRAEIIRNADRLGSLFEINDK